MRLVRHGRAEAGWDDHLDPDLDDVGRAQARMVAAQLEPLGPLDVVTSPLRRCRRTADVLGERWGVDAMIDDAVAEIPSPAGVPTDARVGWLRDAMQREWADLGDLYTGFRDGVVERIRRCERDTVVFSHFVAINAVIGACLDDDRVVIRRLDNCSVTVVEVTAAGEARLVEGGREADTLIR
ncbi:MAG: histidine phosphatase family protein [Ilumatobacteraceae bacterium]